MKDCAYYKTGMPFDPQPGVVYNHENGERYRCLNYAIYVNRYNHASVLPAMQRVTDHNENWTLFAHDMKTYEDGCIAWGYSSGIGFLPNEPYNGDLDFINYEFQESRVWIVKTEIEISNEISSEIVGVYRSEDRAREVQEELINQNAHDVIACGATALDVEISVWEIK